jgi:hypothetical protein
MPTVQLFTVIGAAGLLICIVSLFALHVLPTGFQPIQDPVSNYGVNRYGVLYRSQAFSSGICAACLLAIFAGAGLILPVWGIVALVGYSLSRMLIVFFPTDIKPPYTLTGTIHAILATLTFAGIAFAAGILTPALTSLAGWSNIGSELRAAALLTDVAAIVFIIVLAVHTFQQIVGLIERFLYLGTLLWLGIIFVHLLRSL